MDDDLDAGDLGARGGDRLGGEPPVHRAVAAPEDHPGGLELLDGQPTHRAVRVPHDAVLERPTEVAGPRVAPEVLVGQEEDLAGPVEASGPLQGPRQRRPGVGRRADRAIVPTGERLDGRRRVHVGHGDGVLGDARVDELVPAVLDLGDRRHVRHRAAGREVGEDHGLVVTREDVGRLGHEVHPAEDDPRRVRPRGGLLGELERVTGDVGELDDLVALVVVTEDEDLVAEGLLGRAGTSDQVGVRGGGEVSGALDASLGVQVAALAEHEEGERSSRRGRHAGRSYAGAPGHRHRFTLPSAHPLWPRVRAGGSPCAGSP